MTELKSHCSRDFGPVYDKNSRILILGSFPSVKSREAGFYYYHPQNRFWKVIASVLKESLPASIIDKKAMLIKHHIAVWDVIESCDIIGSSDASICNVEPADINMVLREASIEKLYANGTKAYELYQKYCFKDTNKEILKMPSTSPANASWNLERLLEAWSVIVS